jgi:uncharacterized protein YkwD
MKTKYAALMSLPFTLLPAGVVHATETPTAGARRPVVSDAPGAGRRLLDLVNRERATEGLVPLALRDDVAAIAGAWTRRMAADGRLGHNNAYFRPSTMDRIGAELIGENVAAAPSLDEAHQALMNSPHHRDNIMNPAFRQVGISVVHTAGNKLFLTEDFLTPGRPTPPSAMPAGIRKPPRRARRPNRRSALKRPAPRRATSLSTQSATRR